MIKRISLSILLMLITFAAWADAISVPNNGKNIYYNLSQNGTAAVTMHLQKILIQAISLSLQASR